MTTARPDWYPDLIHPTIERWWNGRAWGAQTREAERADATNHFPTAEVHAFVDADPAPRPPIWMNANRSS